MLGLANGHNGVAGASKQLNGPQHVLDLRQRAGRLEQHDGIPTLTQRAERVQNDRGRRCLVAAQLRRARERNLRPPLAGRRSDPLVLG